MPAPSPRTKPSRMPIEGPRRFRGLVVAGGQGGEQVEAGHAQRVDHAVRAAGQHQVGVAAADQLGRFADGLRAGGAGRQAAVVRPLQPEIVRQVGRRRVQFLLVLLRAVERLQTNSQHGSRIEGRASRADTSGRPCPARRENPASPRPCPGRRRSACDRRRTNPPAARRLPAPVAPPPPRTGWPPRRWPSARATARNGTDQTPGPRPRTWSERCWRRSG